MEPDPILGYAYSPAFGVSLEQEATYIKYVASHGITKEKYVNSYKNNYSQSKRHMIR